jgi:WD domain, G-beta repeat
MTIQAHGGVVHSVVFSPDGRRIASGLGDHTISVWDATTGQVVEAPFADPVLSVAFSLDGQHAPSISDGAMHVEKAVKDDIKIHFTDQVLIDNDGWIYGEGRKLLL